MAVDSTVGHMTHAVVIVGKTGGQLVVALTDCAADANTLAKRYDAIVIRINDLLVKPTGRRGAVSFQGTP